MLMRNTLNSLKFKLGPNPRAVNRQALFLQSRAEHFHRADAG
jgi:hypothetical protein